MRGTFGRWFAGALLVLLIGALAPAFAAMTLPAADPVPTTTTVVVFSPVQSTCCVMPFLVSVQLDGAKLQGTISFLVNGEPARWSFEGEGNYAIRQPPGVYEIVALYSGAPTMRPASRRPSR